jgi:hypothetical protein
MKRILLLSFGAAILGAVPGFTENPPPAAPKVDWCHYSPGQYPQKFLLLTIEQDAVPSHLDHEGDHYAVGGSCVAHTGIPGNG